MFSRVVSNFRKKRRRNEQNVAQPSSSPQLSGKIEKIDKKESIENCELNENTFESLSSVDCINDSADDNNLASDKGVCRFFLIKIYIH